MRGHHRVAPAESARTRWTRPQPPSTRTVVVPSGNSPKAARHSPCPWGLDYGRKACCIADHIAPRGPEFSQGCLDGRRPSSHCLASLNLKIPTAGSKELLSGFRLLLASKVASPTGQVCTYGHILTAKDDELSRAVRRVAPPASWPGSEAH